MDIQNNEKKTSSLKFSEKILIYAQYEAHIVYIIILWILSRDANLATNLSSELIIMFYFFIIISALSIVITYKYIIPKMMKIDDVHEVLLIIVLVIACGSQVPSIFGMLFSIIGFTMFNTIYWQISLLFIILGFSHGIFLHFFKIQPFLSNLKNK